MSKNRFISTTISNIPLKGFVQSDGGLGTGSDVDFLSLDTDFTGYVDYLLFVSGHTAISSDSATSNTTRLRIILRDNTTGNEQIICGSRQGIGATGTSWTGDTLAYMSTSGYFVLTSAYTTNNCTIQLNGGIDSSVGQFHWGDQSSYTNFDAEDLGASLYYILYKQ